MFRSGIKERYPEPGHLQNWSVRVSGFKINSLNRYWPGRAKKKRPLKAAFESLYEQQAHPPCLLSLCLSIKSQRMSSKLGRPISCKS